MNTTKFFYTFSWIMVLPGVALLVMEYMSGYHTLWPLAFFVPGTISGGISMIRARKDSNRTA